MGDIVERPQMRDKPPQYTARAPDRSFSFTAAQLDLVHRRTLPFVRNGTHYSIEHLVQEAYLQGLRDAAEALGAQQQPD